MLNVVYESCCRFCHCPLEGAPHLMTADVVSVCVAGWKNGVLENLGIA